MKPSIHRLTRLSTLCSTALLLSCDAGKDVTASEPGVWVMPRFAEATTVPTSTHSVEGRLSAKGRPDIVLTVPYRSGDIIEFGTLPPQTPFRLTLTGLDSSKTPLWWSYADDTTGSSPVKDVLLSLAPVPLAAGSRLPTNYAWYKGDTLPVPAGAVYTVDGSDPRTSSNARQVSGSGGLVVDSNNTIKVAVRVPGDSTLGQPDLWSPVETYTFGIDVLDTITSLDTLFLSHWSNWDDSVIIPREDDTIGIRSFNATIRPGVWTGDRSERTDTIPRALFGFAEDMLHLYALPRSARATILVNSTVIPADSFVSIPFPIDSVVRVVVRNHRFERSTSIRLVPEPSRAVTLKLDSISSTPGGLVVDSKAKSMSIELPATQRKLILRPYPDSGQILTVRGTDLAAGDSVELEIGSDTMTIAMVLRTTDSSSTQAFKLRIDRSISGLAFRDTTWGVPWRDVAYDTLVDARNGRKYRTVMVGNARWMAENLNFRRDSSFCPAVADSCAKNGRWYRWAAAADTTPAFDAAGLATTIPLKGVCPSGWHLPSETEWRTLVALLGTSKSSSLLRSAGSSWSQGGGEDSVGLRALPAGYRFVDAAYPSFFGTRGQTTDAYFWTSTQSSLDGSRAGSVRISGAAPAVDFLANALKSDAYSVRCVEDAAP